MYVAEEKEAPTVQMTRCAKCGEMIPAGEPSVQAGQLKWVCNRSESDAIDIDDIITQRLVGEALSEEQID